MATTQYKLTYFDGRGLAETARYLLVLGDAKWEDVRLPIAFREEGGFLRPEFDALKASGALPYGQVPLLEVDGQRFAQSRAIERFLARRFNLTGSDELTAARIDAFGEGLADLRTEFNKAHYWAKPEEKEALLAKFFETGLASHLDKLEPNVVEGDLSLADVQLAGLWERFNPDEKRPGLIDNYPKIKARIELFRGNPKIAAYVAARKETPF